MTSEKRYAEDKPWVCGGGKMEDANKEIIEGLPLRRVKGQVGSDREKKSQLKPSYEVRGKS